jgi:hypothetical protein
MTICFSRLRPCDTASRRWPLSHSLVLLAMLALSPPVKAQTVLPSDVQPSCVVAPLEFGQWFTAQPVSKDGIALPANSASFNPNSLCSFYKWSEQMFLWLTSPMGPGRHVFSSSSFYGVEAIGPDRKRGLVPQNDNKLLNFAPDIVLLGQKGQEIVSDDKGQIRNVLRLQTDATTGDLAVRDKSGRQVEVGRVAAAADGTPLLLDKADKVIDAKKSRSGAPLLQDASGAALKLAATTVAVNGVQRLVTISGDVVEFGQAAGNDVLMTQNNGLVYYLIQVNDVFAYFKTGMLSNFFPPPLPAQFPVSSAEVSKITDFAKGAPAPHTKASFSDAVALTLELKSSWVEASTVTNPQDYLIIKATVPNFIASGANKLVPSGAKDVDLALIGLHVVGSTVGHPEMIWATFEHINNTPNLQYSYLNTAGTTALKPADGPGTWLFSKNGATEAPVKSRMKVDRNGTDIVAINPGTIGPIEVTRRNPWGTASDDPSAAGNNTDVVSINNSVRALLPAGDVRQKYILIGATWTAGGQSPNGANEVGTNTLSNSTMETFKQDNNCFECHSGNMLGSGGGGLSHVWGLIKPLFP